MASNKGKKYKRLTGYEVATPEDQARADAFMKWYGDNFNALKWKLIKGDQMFNDGVATDTALLIYEAIALKGARIDSFAHYFFRAYRTNLIAVKPRGNEAHTDELNTIAAPTFNYEEYERVVDGLTNEILEHVRANYNAFAVSLFEIYIGLLPDTSYAQMSEMLNIPTQTIWFWIGRIKKDVKATFDERKRVLLSLV